MSNNIDLANLSKEQGFKVFGATLGGQSGSAVSSAGDFNGDGLDDIIIGAPEAYKAAGASYVIFGKNITIFDNINLANLDKPQGFQIQGINPGDQSGYSVSGAGDFNGDKIDDVIIGAWQAYYSYIIFGKNTTIFDNINLPNLNKTQGFKISGAGFSVSGAGDFNGDNIDDVIIGDGNNWPAGNSYIIFGKNTTIFDNINLANLNKTQGFKISGAGFSVSGAGDFNGDNIDDVIIGAPAASTNKSIDVGVSFIIFGKNTTIFENIHLPNLDKTQGFQILGANALDWSGRSVSGAGDFNGDGVDDIIVGAYQASPLNRQYAGESYVIFGKNTTIFENIHLANLGKTQGFQIQGANQDDYSGFSVSGAGDINADGLDDVIIGALDGNGGTGASYVIFGKNTTVFDNIINLANLTSSQGFQIQGVNANDGCGSSVSGAGDFNGDNIDDVIIGAPGVYNSTGTTYLIYNITASPIPPTPTPVLMPGWELYVEIGVPIVGGLALLSGALFGWYKYNHCNGYFDSSEQASLINQNPQESGTWYT